MGQGAEKRQSFTLCECRGGLWAGRLQRERHPESQGGLEKRDLFPTAEEGGMWLSYSSGSQLEGGEG